VHRIVVALILGLVATSLGRGQTVPNCKPIAPLPPMATFGGPLTAPSGETELGIGVGGSGELNETGQPACGEVELGTTDWFVRWRRGVGGKTDIGFDWLIGNSNSNNGDEGTVKFAVRQRIAKGLRLEAGIGTADSGWGRSVNADTAAVIGTTHEQSTWNYYASLRVGVSRGCVNLMCLGGTGDHPPGGIVPLGAIGATARVADNIQFVMEGGLGDIFSREHPTTVQYVHLSFGVRFEAGKERK
jgi:hypothetical protein